MKGMQVHDGSHEGHKTEVDCNSSHQDLTHFSWASCSTLQGQHREIAPQSRRKKTRARDRHPTLQLCETEPTPTKEEAKHILALSRAGVETQLIMKLMGHSFDTIQRLVLRSERVSREEWDRAEQMRMQQEFGQMLLGSDPFER